VDTHGQKRILGNAVLAANGKAIRATFQQADGTNAMSYGLMEIPFSEAPVREMTLIKNAPVQDEIGRLLFPGGRLARWQDRCHRFDLPRPRWKSNPPSRLCLILRGFERPNWKVTKVPIPMPAQKPSSKRNSHPPCSTFFPICLRRSAARTLSTRGRRVGCCCRAASVARGCNVGRAWPRCCTCGCRPRLSGRFLEIHGAFLW